MPGELLDNPIWNSLRTEHAGLALGDERARRYPQEIGPLSGIPDQSAESYARLRELAGEYPVVLFSREPFLIPSGWQRLRDGQLVQMVRSSAPADLDGLKERPTFRQLTPADAPAMVALAELTEPGPFRLRTLELGNFYGIFHGDVLVAMSGKRMHLPGMVEVSGVCTHPDARGRGYAAHLMSIVIGEIEREGKTPFLHAFAENPAVRLYERLGFRLRQRFELAVIQPKD
ncbi:GNAT family N-acetyltransferase [Acidobacteria bacterium AB60]|nr:GNAT family N-acetyltransferase [Acidobacteria bacterium AB60]